MRRTPIAGRLLTTVIVMVTATAWSCSDPSTAEISGESKTWHKTTLTFRGPFTSEYDTVNPFTDYRLDVEFSNGTDKYLVPGYFAADGNAAETSAREGDKWRVHFSPPSEGTWNYKVSFLQGRDIAVAVNTEYGEKCFPDGMTGSIEAGRSDKQAPDFRARGRLMYNGTHFLHFAGTGEVFLKGGADSPENFLGYREFDGTYYGGTNKARSGEAAPNSGLHLYEPHIKDWNEGDPQWKNGKGKGIIGALNYLSSKGMNSFYFLTMNILGDGEDVWPYTDRNERYRFDCSKLDQWEIVFEHADRLGIMKHFVLQETENESLLDCGYLDVQRKLYLRELIARFSHNLAVTWNLGEEHHATEWSPYGQTYRDTKLMADYLRETDPYNNFIVIHTHASPQQRLKDMTEYLGFRNVEGPSVQCGNVDQVHDDAKYWLRESAKANHKWVVCSDEIGQHWKGAMPDEFDPGHDTIRHKVLWGNLMAGGAGVEWYFGYNFPHSDLNCEDWRSRDILWDQTRFALEFFHKYLPFTEMTNDNEIIRDDISYCLVKEGEVYAIYMPQGGETEIRLPQGDYSVEWYNPRTGGDLVKGRLTNVNGGGFRSTGNPPASDGKDWVCLIRKQ